MKIINDKTLFEKEPMTNLSKDKNLKAFKHEKFWKCMDTLRDKMYLSELWENQEAPWKIWND